MLNAQLKSLAKNVCPPAMWNVARHVYRASLPSVPEIIVEIAPEPPGPTYDCVANLDEIDSMIARATRAGQQSHDDYWSILSNHRFPVPHDLPADPESPEYHDAQMQLYREVSGRDCYNADTCEPTPFDVANAVDFPFPYRTGSWQLVGNQLQAVGYTIGALNLPPPGRILEFGSGYGMLTLELAQLKYRVTAVDISPFLLEVIDRRAGLINCPIETVCSNMLNFRPKERFDRVLFYECFHHCSDPVGMIRRLDELVTHDGAVVFAGEPIEDDFPMPWGIRLDGLALREIRVSGWLELGFRTDFFFGLLDRNGWHAERKVSADNPSHTVIVARRKTVSQPFVDDSSLSSKTESPADTPKPRRYSP